MNIIKLLKHNSKEDKKSERRAEILVKKALRIHKEVKKAA